MSLKKISCVYWARPVTTSFPSTRGVGFPMSLHSGGDRGHDGPGRAIAALVSVLLDERLLDGMKGLALGQAFDGDDLFSVGSNGGGGARKKRPARGKHRAAA